MPQSRKSPEDRSKRSRRAAGFRFWLVVSPSLMAFAVAEWVIVRSAWENAWTILFAIPLFFALLRMSWIAWGLRRDGLEVSASDTRSLFLGSLFWFFVILLTVVACASVGSGMAEELALNLYGQPEADDALSTLYSLIFAGMALCAWEPLLEGRFEWLYREKLKAKANATKQETPSPARPDSSLTQPQGFRFELGTLLVFVTLVCVNLGLAMASLGLLLGIDAIILVAVIRAASNIRQPGRDARGVMLFDWLDAFWSEFWPWIAILLTSGLAATWVISSAPPESTWATSLGGVHVMPAWHWGGVMTGLVVACLWSPLLRVLRNAGKAMGLNHDARHRESSEE